MTESSAKCTFVEVARSGVWNDFLKGTGEKTGRAQCKTCKKELSCAGGSTKGLLDHLERKHGKSRKSQSSVATSSSSVSGKKDAPRPRQGLKQTTIDACVKKKDSLQCRYARMASSARISFRVLANSTDIRDGLASLGYVPLRSPTAVKDAVMSHYRSVKASCERDLEKTLRSGQLVSLTFDEWTSTAQRRYVGILAHSSKFFESGRPFWNLGLKRIKDSMPASRCIELVAEHLNQFGVDLHTHVLSMTTDGASVMVKMGRLLDDDVPVHQLCLAHGVHLAVVDTFYKHAIVNADSTEQKGEESCSDADSDSDASYIGVVPEFSDVVVASLPRVINRVREIVRKFRKSPLLTDRLEKHIKQDMPGQLPVPKLVLDVKTRWNSLPPMINRFLLLEKSIRKALLDSDTTLDLWNFSGEELAILRHVANLLEPVELAVKALCREDVSLLQADASMKFVLRKLVEQTAQHDVLGSLFLSNIACRFQQRRCEFATVLQWLANPLYDYELEKLLCHLNHKAFVPMDTTTRQRLLLQIAEKLSVASATTSAESAVLDVQQETDRDTEMVTIGSDSNEDAEAVDNPGVSARIGPAKNAAAKASSSQDELLRELEAAKKLADPDTTALKISLPLATVSSIVRKEVAVLKASGQRGALLDKVFDALMTTRPTSVDVERVFSSCANICTPEKNRLNDETFDALSFLCSFFKRE
jgi:hypothetical protein